MLSVNELEGTRGEVYIHDVVDARVFEAAPRNPSTPSLKDGQITNPDITSRAIARKRNSYGRAMGDVLLPDDRTVMELVEENVSLALRNSGYLVVDGDTEGATPVSVRIDEFWAWFSPGFWAVKIEFRSALQIETNIPGFEEPVSAYAREKHGAATGGAWVQTIGVGMDDLRSNIEERLGAE